VTDCELYYVVAVQLEANVIGVDRAAAKKKSTTAAPGRLSSSSSHASIANALSKIHNPRGE
jgi:hypothetical protein